MAVAPRTPAEVAETAPYRAFAAELRNLGYVEGQHVVIERWTAAGRVEHYADLARDVAQSQADVVVAASDLKVALIGTPLRDPITEAEYERVFGIMTRERVQAVIVNDHPANYASSFHRGPGGASSAAHDGGASRLP